MKIIAYAVRKDELDAIDIHARKFNFVVTLESRNLNAETAELAVGYDMVSFLGNCKVDREVLQKLSKAGIKYIASRSTGYNNIDLESAKEFGIHASNVFYSPHSVAEFSVMSAMTMLRNLPSSMKRVSLNNFSLGGLQGKELRTQKVGIIGAGKIGREAIKCFSGFGCEVVAYDPFPTQEAKDLVPLVSFEELIETCDVISLHSPLFEENMHLFNKDTFAKMKEGVVIINTSRGELIKTNDLIEALRTKKVAAAALDVIENEQGVFHHDHSASILSHDQLSILKAMPNVQITPHHAFYTKEAVSDMVENAFNNLNLFFTTGDAPNALV